MARGRIVSEGSVDALRARVSMKRVRCATRFMPAEVVDWPGVVEAARDGDRLCIATEHPEAVVRRLLALDPDLSCLEVRAAGLAEAFTELTRDDAVASLAEAA
jgi:ABC-2 type transport system ATP-binding protein